MDNKQRLFELAIQLADVEDRLCSSDQARGLEMSYSEFTKSQKMKAVVSGAGAFVSLIFVIINGGSGLLGLLFGACFIFALQNLYIAYGGIQFGEKNKKEQKQVQGGRAQDHNQRIKLRNELIRMQNEDADLPRECWWNTDTDPENRKTLPVEMNPDYRFIIANELSFSSKEGKVFLEDFTRVPVIYTREQMYEKLNSKSRSVLYENPKILEGNQFICYHLYFGEMEPIEEISGKTTTIINDKDARLKEFEAKLDRQEIFINHLDGIGFRTNWEAYHAGELSRDDYRDRIRIREWEVNEKVRKLDEEPDSYEHTEYQKRYRGLVKNTFITCAYIFCAADGQNEGKTALIISSGKLVPVLDLIYRSDDPERPYSGYLTDYGNQEGMSIRKMEVMIEFRDVVDYLFSQEIKANLALKERNILLPKPGNMNDEEWCYLIWKDHPRKPHSNEFRMPPQNMPPYGQEIEIHTSVAPPAHMSRNIKYCIYCGTELPKDAMFCTECGAKISE